MKIVTKLFLSLCFVFALGATVTSNAQIASSAKIRAKIPYAFEVGDTTLPAGTYEIRVADDFADLNLLQIQSATGKTTVFFDTESIQLARAKRDSELEFEKIGEMYFLTRVFLAGDDSGNELPKSKRQRKLEERGLTAANHSIAASPVKGKSSKQVARKMR